MKNILQINHNQVQVLRKKFAQQQGLIAQSRKLSDFPDVVQFLKGGLRGEDYETLEAVQNMDIYIMNGNILLQADADPDLPIYGATFDGNEDNTTLYIKVGGQVLPFSTAADDQPIILISHRAAFDEKLLATTIVHEIGHLIDKRNPFDDDYETSGREKFARHLEFLYLKWMEGLSSYKAQHWLKVKYNPSVGYGN